MTPKERADEHERQKVMLLQEQLLIPANLVELKARIVKLELRQTELPALIATLESKIRCAKRDGTAQVLRLRIKLQEGRVRRVSKGLPPNAEKQT